MPRPPNIAVFLLAGLATVALLASCGDSGGGGGGGAEAAGGGENTSWQWGVPPGFPKPRVPEDNPMTEEKVALGRKLFYDVRISENETQSCGSCHLQELAFTDGRPHGIGSTGEVHPRSSMGLTNVAYLSALTWANPILDRLEEQARLPLFGENPIELGFAGREDELLARIAADADYPAEFSAAFPEEADPISILTVTRAIAAFERTLISANSPFDRFAYGGDPTALSESAKRGRDIFFSEETECFHCHGGFNFSDSVAHDGTAIVEVMFHNTGLYNLGGTGAYPEDNTGLYEVTGVLSDMGRFRAPTLRNIAKTAPYFHDGSAATLEEVIEHYAAGGRTIATGPNAGVGSENPYKSEFVTGFDLTTEQKADLVAFLEALTDESFLSNPQHSNPWTAP